MAEVNRKIDDMGQVDESKGIAATKKYIAEFNKENAKNDQKRIKFLGTLSKNKKKYFNQISGLLNDEIEDMDLAKKYIAWSEFDEKGVILRLVGPKGKFHRAFKPAMKPAVDFEAVVGLLIQLQDQIDLELYEKARSLERMGFVLPS